MLADLPVLCSYLNIVGMLSHSRLDDGAQCLAAAGIVEEDLVFCERRELGPYGLDIEVTHDK